MVGVGERDPEPAVDRGQVLHRRASTRICHSRSVSGSPGLQHRRPGAGTGRRTPGRPSNFGPGRLVESGELAHGELLTRPFRSPTSSSVLDQHAEVGAPVAEVRGPDHGVAKMLQDPDDRVTDHRGAQMAGVQFLGHVRPGIVDGDDRWAGSRRCHAQPRVGELVVACAAIQSSRSVDVDEPGTADVGPLADVSRAAAGWRSRRRASRGGPPQPLGQRQGHVGLVVGERGGPDERVGAGVLAAESGGECLAHPFRQHVPRIHANQPSGPRGEASRPEDGRWPSGTR